MYDMTWKLQLRAVLTLVLVITGWGMLYTHSPLFVIWGICALLFCLDCIEKRKELGQKVRNLFSVDAKWNLINSFASVTLFSLITYGFLFANEIFSHDSVQQTFYSPSPGTGRFYLEIGRFIIPLYEKMKGAYSAPWFIGLLFVLWMTFTSFFVIELFQLKGRLIIVMTSGVLCVNTALILTGTTYTYCLDEYALALLTSTVAAYCLCRVSHGELLGILLVIFSLGIYQAYFTVTMVLCFLFAIQQSVKNELPAKVVCKGLKQIGLLVISVGTYYAIWTIICAKLEVSKSRTDELAITKGLAGILEAVKASCVSWVENIFDPNGFLGHAYATANLFLVAILIWTLFRFLCRKNVRTSAKCLVVILSLCAPLVFSSPTIILGVTASMLTTYTYELIYIFALLGISKDESGTAIPAEDGKTQKARIMVLILVGFVIYNNVLFANQAYMKKEHEKVATISLVTRMIERVENLEGYSLGETPVYLVGELRYSSLNRGKMDVPYLESKHGLWYNYSATYNLPRYITDYLNYPMKVSAKPELAEVDEVKDMPIFPAQGSIKIIDGAAVVKLS